MLFKDSASTLFLHPYSALSLIDNLPVLSEMHIVTTGRLQSALKNVVTLIASLLAYSLFANRLLSNMQVLENMDYFHDIITTFLDLHSGSCIGC